MDKPTFPDGTHLAEHLGDLNIDNLSSICNSNVRLLLYNSKKQHGNRHQQSTSVDKRGDLTPCWNDQWLHPAPDNSMTDGCQASLPEPYTQQRRMSWQDLSKAQPVETRIMERLSRPPPANRSQVEHKALKCLREDDSIVISPTDNRSIVGKLIVSKYVAESIKN